MSIGEGRFCAYPDIEAIGRHGFIVGANHHVKTVIV
jgi:hypothetical protein